MTLDTIVSAIRKTLSQSTDANRRVLVAVAGPPGAGKSTFAQTLRQYLHERGTASRIVPMDGFHLDNAILSKRNLLPRKGAPETFDTAGFVNLIKRLHAGEADVVIPVFDRTRDIAIAGAEIVTPADRLLIVEGNYLLLNAAPWDELHQFWDHTIFINPGLEILEQRLIQRWIDHDMPIADAKNRALQNDIPNAKIVLEQSTAASFILT